MWEYNCAPSSNLMPHTFHKFEENTTKCHEIKLINVAEVFLAYLK